MKHLKTFESYGKIDSDIHEDIAMDILPKLQKLKDEKGTYTVQDFENYMKEKGADSLMIDSVMSSLVSMGFDFDAESEDEYEPVEFELKNIAY
jgi:hypothetical protein